MSVQFRKYQALGNDYIVIDPREFPFIPEAKAIRAICDRNYGAGSDGILLGPLSGFSDLGGLPAGHIAQGASPWVRIFNPDGSEAEKSGNGLRIFCLYLAEEGYVEDRPFYVET
jgi:diaminopimelate epimerase